MFYLTYNTKASIKFGLILCTIIFLSYAIFTEQKYGFYVSLKIFICITSIYHAVLSYQSRQNFWLVRFAIIAIIYNPFIKFPLGKDIWIIINTITLLFYAIALFRFKITNNEPINNPLVINNNQNINNMTNEVIMLKEIQNLKSEIENLKKIYEKKVK